MIKWFNNFTHGGCGGDLFGKCEFLSKTQSGNRFIPLLNSGRDLHIHFENTGFYLHFQRINAVFFLFSDHAQIVEKK